MRSLNERAVACKHFGWMPGMLAIDPDDPHREDDIRVVGVSARGRLIGSGGRSDGHHIGIHPGMRVPDLEDPATLGCLMALVWKAWGKTGIGFYTVTKGMWEVDGIPVQGLHPSLAEAMLAALESARAL